MLAFTISSAKFYQIFIERSYLIVCCETLWNNIEQQNNLFIFRKQGNYR